MAGLHVYKRTQGKYTRWITFAAVMVLVAAGAYQLSGYLESFRATQSPFVRYFVAAGLVLGAGLLMFWIVNRPKTADFLIATEGEMKKVSWSSKKEIVGSTKVVILTTFIVASILFAVDLAFTLLFKWIL